MLTLSLLLALPIQDDAKISIDLPISPLPVVLKQLELQTGYAHHVSGPGRDQQVFVSVKDLPSAKVREAIAKVSDGTWTQSGGAYYLATKNQTSLKDAAYRKQVSTWFSKQKPVPVMSRAAIDANVRKSVQLSKEAEKDDKKMMELYALEKTTPKHRLVARVLSGLGQNEVLSLAEDERRVYALNPTVLQKQLPSSSASALTEFVREQSEFRDSVSRIIPATGADDEFGGWNPLIDPYMGETENRPAAAMMLAVKRSRGIASYELMLFDAKGARVETESGSLGREMEDMMLEAEDGTPALSKAFDGLDMPLALSEEDKLFAKDLRDTLMGGMVPGAAKEKAPISTATRERLLNMDKVDPLTFGPTQMLRQFAAVKKKQVVAKVTDLAIFSVAFGVDIEKAPTLGSAVSLALGTYGSKFDGYEETDDLITLRPQPSDMMPFPVEMNRRTTANFLREVDRGGDMLESLSVLASLAEGPDDLQLPLFLSTLFGNESYMYFADQVFDLLKLYGQLNQNQKAAAKQGGLVLPINSLSGPMAQQVRKILLSGERDLNMGMEGIASAATAPESASSGPSFGLGSDHYNDEITVKLTRLPANTGRVVVNLAGKEQLFMRSSVGMFGGSQPANPSMIAYSLLQSEQNPNEEMFKLTGFSYGIQKILTAKISFGETEAAARSLALPDIAKDAKLLKLSDLSPEFQKQVQDLLAEYRKQMQSGTSGFGGGGGAAKPPAK